jgi:hypothetical protein
MKGQSIMKNSINYNNTQKSDACMEVSASFHVTTRRQRKRAISIMIQILKILSSAEKQHMDNIPDHQLGSSQYDDAEQAICALDEALDCLEGAYH